MPIQNIPEIFITKNKSLPDLFVYDYRMTEATVKNKANLGVKYVQLFANRSKACAFCRCFCCGK